jgi:hypothetical protein
MFMEPQSGTTTHFIEKACPIRIGRYPTNTESQCKGTLRRAMCLAALDSRETPALEVILRRRRAAFVPLRARGTLRRAMCLAALDSRETAAFEVTRLLRRAAFVALRARRRQMVSGLAIVLFRLAHRLEAHSAVSRMARPPEFIAITAIRV